jgi:hypothetical protein
LAQALALVSLTAIASAQVPAGPEFRVNALTTGYQGIARGAVAMAPGGEAFVVWSTSPNPPVIKRDVLGQRFDASGSPRGASFSINTYTTGEQHSAIAAMDATGDIVVVWNSNPLDGSGYDVFGQRFTAAGIPRGSEFRVNLTTAGTQWVTDHGIASDAAGNFIVVWYSDDQDGSGRGVVGRRFDAFGAPRGGEFQVNTYTTGFQSFATVAVGGPGFVVVWRSHNQDGSSYGIFGQRFDASGAPVGVEFPVNTYTTGIQHGPVVAADSDGNFIVAWRSDGQDGSLGGVIGRRFDASGTALGPDFQVNSYTTGNQFLPSVACDADGGFVISWQSDGGENGGSGYGVFARRFDRDGLSRGGEFQVNTYTTSHQGNPSVAVDAVGNILIAWTSLLQDGSNNGVYGQRFGGLGPAALAVDSAGNQVLEPCRRWRYRPVRRLLRRLGVQPDHASGGALGRIGGRGHPSRRAGPTEAVALARGRELHRRVANQRLLSLHRDAFAPQRDRRVHADGVLPVPRDDTRADGGVRARGEGGIRVRAARLHVADVRRRPGQQPLLPLD